MKLNTKNIFKSANRACIVAPNTAICESYRHPLGATSSIGNGSSGNASAQS